MKYPSGIVGRVLPLAAVSLVVALGTAAAVHASAAAETRIASGALEFTTQLDYQRLTLRVSGQGRVIDVTFEASDAAVFVPAQNGLADGAYSYELVVVPRARAERRGDDARAGLERTARRSDRVHSGSFRIMGGALIEPRASEARELRPKDAGSPAAAASDVDDPNRDQVIPDDLIVQGSICTGFDCVNNENFGFDTLRLKENNLRIGFDDTSVGTFPANDWQLTANDSASGGANKFSIDDITGARTPFTIEAGATTNSLYVDSTGRVGFRTATPVLDLHVRSGNTPAMRLEQDGSSGFTPQTWDVAGNEANFFVRDVTGGSRLPLRIRPGAPTSSIEIAGSGRVGLGLSAPLQPLHLKRTDGTAQLLVEEASATSLNRTLLELRNSGSVQFFYRNTTDNLLWQTSAFVNAFQIALIGTDKGQFRVLNNGGLQALRGSNLLMVLDQTGNMTISGALTEGSDHAAKEQIAPVDSLALLERLSSLPISEWSYRGQPGSTRHLGPMAQDFHAAFGLGSGPTGISTLDTSGVALASIQGLYRLLQKRDAEIEQLSAENSRLAERLARIEALLIAGQAAQP